MSEDTGPEVAAANAWHEGWKGGWVFGVAWARKRAHKNLIAAMKSANVFRVHQQTTYGGHDFEVIESADVKEAIDAVLTDTETGYE